MLTKEQDLIPLKNNAISIDNIVNRSNRLLSSIETPLSAGAFKLFETYLSLINPLDSTNTEVVIRKADYQKLLNKKQIRTHDLEKFTVELSKLQYGIGSDNSRGRLRLNLFECVGVYVDKDSGEILIAMKCTESAKSLLFNIETMGYIKYQLKNTLLLDTDYEIRLYVYLLTKAYKKFWQVSFYQLKKELYCENVKQYQSYGEFNRKVLSKAINKINERTNLTVSYEYLFKRGKGAGSGNIQFTIIRKDNTVFADSVEAFKAVVPTPQRNEKIDKKYLKACNNEFTADEIIVLLKSIEHLDREWLKSYTAKDTVDEQNVEYLMMKYNEMKVYNPKTNRFKYLLKMIINDSENRVYIKRTSSYDIEELEKIDTLDNIE